MKSLFISFLFEEEINALKKELKPEKTAISKIGKSKSESILSNIVNETIQPLVVMKINVRSTCLLLLNPLSLAKLS
jgi:hypothetical protein